MSAGPLFWALKQQPGTQLDKLILIGICNEVDVKSGSALLGLEDLALFAGASMRAVRDSLKRLEGNLYIRSRETVVIDNDGARGWTRFYPMWFWREEASQRRSSYDLLNSVDDWSTPERVFRWQMQTFTKRIGEAKDKQHNKGNGRSRGTRKEVPGTETDQTPRKEVPGTYPEAGSGGTRKEVPGTYPEAGSGPSISPPLPSFPPPPGAVTKAVDQVDEDEEEIAEETHRTARQMVAGLRFRADRFLMPQAKQQVTGLVVQRLRDGWPPEFLGRKLGEWAEQAGNPSTYLPVQLDQLGAPRPRPQVVPDEKPASPPPANEGTRAAVMAQLRAQGRPARPVSRKAVTAPDDGKPEPERALASLDALLGELKGARSSS